MSLAPVLLRLLSALALVILAATAAAASPPTFARPNDAVHWTVAPGTSSNFLLISVLPGEAPASTGLRVWLDLRPFGGPAEALFVDARLVCDDDTGDGTFFACFTMPHNAPPGTRELTLTVADRQGRSSTRTITMTVPPPIDTDGDGLPDNWEALFGLDPNSPAGINGAAGDADGDGLSNVEEFAAGSHPRGTVTRYFADGAVNGFFSTVLDLFNPSPSSATIVLRFLGSDGVTTSTTVGLGTIGLVDSRFLADEPAFSPDGRFVAYHSTESGQAEVFVTSVAAPSTRWQVSRGGVQPRWRADGHELYYLSLDGDVMAVGVTRESPWRAEAPRLLMRVGADHGLLLNDYAARADGEQFLIKRDTGGVASRLDVILGWRP